MPPIAISFDLGQTLVEFDETLFAQQAKKKGFWLAQSQVEREQPAAWSAYNAAKASGQSGFDAWSAFVRTLLTRIEFSSAERRAPVDAEQREEFIRYLWSEQPHNNLWRRPVPGMLELVQSLAQQGVRVGVLTNSEGGAKELVEAAGIAESVTAVVDSGIEGMEKPDPRLFALMAERLGCDVTEVIHVGDSYEADVLGALRARMTPVWFVREPTVTLPPGVLWCRNAEELRSLLQGQPTS